MNEVDTVSEILVILNSRNDQMWQTFLDLINHNIQLYRLDNIAVKTMVHDLFPLFSHGMSSKSNNRPDLHPNNGYTSYVRLVGAFKRGIMHMARQVFKPEQIISKLREAEILLSNGQTIQTAVRQISVTEQTYYGV